MSQAIALKHVELPLVSALDMDVSPLGYLVGVTPTAELAETAFYHGAVKLLKPGPFESDDDTALSLARVDPRVNEVVWMERHFKHTQAFLPLGGKPYVVVMAPPNNKDLPDIDQAMAIRFPGDMGFMMRVGTWHEFPFALEPATDVVVILRNETNRDLKQLKDDEAEGEDLQKRNIRARLGLNLTFSP
jgi:ureidoglycolate lyase